MPHAGGGVAARLEQRKSNVAMRSDSAGFPLPTTVQTTGPAASFAEPAGHFGPHLTSISDADAWRHASYDHIAKRSFGHGQRGRQDEPTQTTGEASSSSAAPPRPHVQQVFPSGGALAINPGANIPE